MKIKYCIHNRKSKKLHSSLVALNKQNDCVINDMKSQGNNINSLIEEFSNYDYLVTINDDVVIKNKKFADIYIDMMQKYDLPVSFYAYYRGLNVLPTELNSKKCPALLVTIDDNKKIECVRSVAEGMVIYDIKQIQKHRIHFHDNLSIMYLNTFIDDIIKRGLYPFDGVYLHPVTDKELLLDECVLNKKDYQYIQQDRQYLETIKYTPNHQVNVDRILKYINDKEEK